MTTPNTPTVTEPSTDTAPDERREYRREIERRIDQLNERIASLKQSAEEAGSKAKAEISEAIDGLKEKRRSFQAGLADLVEDSDEIWEDVKDGVENAWHDLKGKFDRVAARLTGGDKDEEKS